jgi:hypothetical protein
MRVHYLTMDNTPIHTPAKVCDLDESRNYKCLYLPPCSPFLNPIENFWDESQGWIRSALSAGILYATQLTVKHGSDMLFPTFRDASLGENFIK